MPAEFVIDPAVIAELRRGIAAVQQYLTLPMEQETVENEGEYGSGPDTYEGFTSFSVLDANGRSLFDTLNSDTVLVEVEYDEEGGSARDIVGYLTTKLAAGTFNALPYLLSAAEALPQVQAERDAAVERVKVLEEALGPLAEVRLIQRWDAGTERHRLPRDGERVSISITAGECRRARSALQQANDMGGVERGG